MKIYSTLVLIILFFANCVSLADTNISANPYQGRWYKVELIIYTHFTQQGLDSEQWPLTLLAPPNWQQATELKPVNLANLQQGQSGKMISFQLLPKQDFSLGKDVNAINQQPYYQVILQKSWYQPVEGANKSRPIHLFGGQSYTAQNWEVNGTMTINVQRFFNVHFNLVFTEPVSRLAKISGSDYFNNFTDGYAQFHLVQTRRMRSGELNYIGFPIFGILIKVTNA